MRNLAEVMHAFLKDENGATVVEYGLILALIAIVAMAGVVLIGKNINGKFNEAATIIDSAGN